MHAAEAFSGVFVHQQLIAWQSVNVPFQLQGQEVAVDTIVLLLACPQKYRVDAVLMKENVAELSDPDNPMSPVKRVNLLNTGVYVMRATNGTVSMVEVSEGRRPGRAALHHEWV
jgi:hypothetical protein